MNYRLEFEIMGLPKTTNAQTSMHWAQKAKMTRYWHQMVALAVGPNRPPKPLSKAILTLTRFSSRCPDPDGLVSTFKHVIDGLVRYSVLKDDRYENISMPIYKWEKTGTKNGKIKVLVEG